MIMTVIILPGMATIISLDCETIKAFILLLFLWFREIESLRHFLFRFRGSSITNIREINNLWQQSSSNSQRLWLRISCWILMTQIVGIKCQFTNSTSLSSWRKIIGNPDECGNNPSIGRIEFLIEKEMKELDDTINGINTVYHRERSFVFNF